MQILSYLWPRRYISGAKMGAALVVSMSVAGGALAASSPSVGDPQGITSQSPYQLDLSDYQAQGVGLSNFSVLKEGEEAGGYKVTLPPGQTGPAITFNQTIKDLRMGEVYADVRFRKAMSLAINRDELNEALWFGLGTPGAALPLGVALSPTRIAIMRSRLMRMQPMHCWTKWA
ncbi:ABC transporter substrate-binding protein [Parasedimentitalea psychrophila]|uniref:ABC transporter substrate-binding protein n=1 Tax=Parasedimentitalea psychrophila TaxID=2997337 RepID=A0A9Y2P6E2_9RHOB|nr:ABC transporter substrate-binding protein [Parasedimentitalea psychrophila]WIY27344.1 ABC transporter substrate-binding protein [Parasedimentitalea psychrophila]